MRCPRLVSADSINGGRVLSTFSQWGLPCASCMTYVICVLLFMYTTRAVAIDTHHVSYDFAFIPPLFVSSNIHSDVIVV